MDAPEDGTDDTEDVGSGLECLHPLRCSPRLLAFALTVGFLFLAGAETSLGGRMMNKSIDDGDGKLYDQVKCSSRCG